MGFHLYEDVWETSTTTGTGAYTLAGAVAGWRTFASQYANADTLLYCAFDGTNFENGVGTYNAGVLTRTTIYRSTNANAAVSWSAGTRQIMVAPLGVNMEQLMNLGSVGFPHRDSDNGWTYFDNGQMPGIATNAAAGAGKIGELITNSNAVALPLTANTPAQMGVVALTAGDWQISGGVQFSGGATSTVSYLIAALNATTATVAIVPQFTTETCFFNGTPFGGGLTPIIQTPVLDLELSGSANFFLNVQAGFATSTCSAFQSFLRARRVR